MPKIYRTILNPQTRLHKFTTLISSPTTIYATGFNPWTNITVAAAAHLANTTIITTLWTDTCHHGGRQIQWTGNLKIAIWTITDDATSPSHEKQNEKLTKNNKI